VSKLKRRTHVAGGEDALVRRLMQVIHLHPALVEVDSGNSQTSNA
jgi:hypothetical protein